MFLPEYILLNKNICNVSRATFPDICIVAFTSFPNLDNTSLLYLSRRRVMRKLRSHISFYSSRQVNSVMPSAKVNQLHSTRHCIIRVGDISNRTQSLGSRAGPVVSVNSCSQGKLMEIVRAYGRRHIKARIYVKFIIQMIWD